MSKISIIIPCYFNEENLPVTMKALLENEKAFPEGTNVEYVFVDDGSKDNTWGELKKIKSQNQDRITLVKLAGNVGSYNAVVAGMKYSTGDCNVFISADLQDPPELIPQMFAYWQKGIKFVVANRTDREESFSQKLFSNTYHRLIKRYALPHVPKGGFDMVLFDKQLKEEVLNIQERNTNTVYLLAWLNYDFVSIPYVRRKREIGVSRWTMKKKIKLFIDSFVSFSFAPIRAITIAGLLLGIVAFLYALLIVISKIRGGIDVEGWSAMMVTFLFVSSFQMIGLGILGEYVWRALDASRKRPIYVVDQVHKANE